MKNIKLLVAVSFFTCLAGQITAQDLLITNSKDTIRGKVKFYNMGELNQNVMVKSKKKKTTLFVSDVYEIQKENGDLYHVRKKGNRYEFMRLLQPGHLSLYLGTDEDIYNPQSFTQKILVKSSGESMVLPNMGFKKRMSAFLEACPGVVNSIQAKKLTKGDMEEIITTYNSCIESTFTNNGSATETTQVPTPSIDELIEEVAASDLPDKAETIQILKDIKLKKGANDSIPSYLKSALLEALDSIPELKSKAEKILE